MPVSFQPVVRKLDSPPDVLDALRSVADLPYPILFDSADPRSPFSRYSFLSADPCRVHQLATAEYGAAPFDEFRGLVEHHHTAAVPGLPPFQGGVAGMLGYELNACFERIPRPAVDEFQMPILVAGLYDWVLVWDHAEQQAWLISQGLPETDPPSRLLKARQREREILDRLEQGPVEPSDSLPDHAAWLRPTRSPRRRINEQFPLNDLQPAGIRSDFSQTAYLDAVNRVIEYIHAGDIFQANLSQRLLYPTDSCPLELYRRLRERNPAPFAGFFAGDDWAILSASPERFLAVRGRHVETRPIKGTRRRKMTPEADLFTRDELRQSDKDQAENVMIVDLLRNDLSRVCEPGSIRVPALCVVETYQTVQHLVSEIHGRLRDSEDVWSLLEAAFPGGSITGAPKVRAMEIILELEPVARGPYCGSLFYHGLDGSFDSSILIRTFTQRSGWVQCPVGGGIVAQSEAQAEYEETLHKAAGMLRALEP